MRFSATLTAALGAMPLVANALPTTNPRNGANAVRTYHPRDATPLWVRNMQAVTVDARPAAGAGAVEVGAGAGAEAGNKQKNKEKAAGEEDAQAGRQGAEREGAEDAEDDNNAGDDNNDNAKEKEKEKQKNKEKQAGEGAAADRENAGREGANRDKDKAKEKEEGAGRGGQAAEEVEVQGVFGQLVELKANTKTDVIFPGAAGNFEVEFQSKQAAKVAVIENKTPGPAPKGFKLLEASSFVVSLVGEARGADRAQLDFIFNNANPAVAAVDVKKATIGQFNAQKNIFEVGNKVGESEFEAEENEVVLKPKNMQGEFAVFIPDDAAAVQPPPAAAPPVAAPPVANGTLPIPPPPAAAPPPPPAAGEGANNEGGENAEKEEDEIAVVGEFNKVIDVVGGKQQQGIRFSEGVAGSFEVEFGGQAANKVLVSQAAPKGKAPAGFAFVDPQAFTVQTEAAPVEGDLLKIDYFFSAATEGLVDVNQGRIGKLDAAKGEYVVDGVGEFEVEAEEKEWTLTVADLNGEWAILIPQAAVKGAAGNGAAAKQGGVAKAKHHQ